jgi:hypothetical protein
VPVLTIETVLVPWLEARDARLANKVQPMAAAPPTAGPYLTYQRVASDNWAELRRTTRIHVARLQLDVWGQDHAEVHSIAAKVQGDKADPGLNGFQGGMGGVYVQQAFLMPPGVADEYEDPDDGSEAGWYRARGDYEIVWNEGT